MILRLLSVAALLTLPVRSWAQDSTAAAAATTESAAHTGFFVQAGAGQHQPTGPFYENRLTNGIAWRISSGIRIPAFLAVGVGVYFGGMDVKGQDVKDGTEYGTETGMQAVTLESRIFPLGSSFFEPYASVSAGMLTVSPKFRAPRGGYCGGVGVGSRLNLAKAYIDGELRYTSARLEHDSAPPEMGDDVSAVIAVGVQF